MRISIFLFFFLFGIAALEGTSSLFLFLYDVSVRRPRVEAEKRYTRHDPELGWVSVANLNIPDMFGDNKALRTNAAGFRSEREFEPEASDKKRFLCAGDSFTFGYGVGNDQTWCHVLQSIDSRVETINMGQSGYGIDQAYLWYRRGAAQFQHEALLFAFIEDDFLRIRRRYQSGYEKPLLEMRNGELTTRNLPLKQPGVFAQLREDYGPRINELRTSQFLRRGYEKVFSAFGNADSPQHEIEDAQIRRVAAKIFEELRRVTDQRKAALYLIYLPTLEDLERNEPSQWRVFAETEAARKKIDFIDLTPAFENLTLLQKERMFITTGQVPFFGAEGHYTEEGNDFVAKLIHASIKLR